MWVFCILRLKRVNLYDMQKDKVKILILAAGKGTRMQSELPKVLVPLHGKAMIKHVLDEISKLHSDKAYSIVGHKSDMVKEELGDLCNYIIQEEQLGTGHAVLCAKNIVDAENIIVLSGDQPFISSDTIKKLIDTHINSNAKITLTTTTLPDFESWHKNFLRYGRILRNDGEIIGMREYKDASEEEKNIHEVNVGAYAFEANWLWKNLEQIKNENAQSEYYLTDLVKIAKEEGEKIASIEVHGKEALGANSKEELEVLENFA